MGIAGVGNYNYANYYQNNVNRHNEQASSTFNMSASGGIELHMTDGETGTKALTSVGFHNGTSASVFKADNYTDENPQYLVKYWDEKGEIQEYTVNPKEVDPSNASYIEMLAYATYSDVQGYTTDAYENFMSAAGGTSADIEYDSTNINAKKNFKAMVEEFMQMQYDAGNISGYLSYKQFYDYMEGTTAYVGDNGIAVKGTDGTEFVAEYSNVSWHALMDAVEQMQGNPLDKQTWNKAMQDYAENKVEDSEVTETQIQELLKDNNERRFELYGPNAPEEVKQAWMKAAEETGLNGLGMNAGGQMSHITQLDVQRAIKWYNGENPDVLRTTVESARQAVEKALYDLEHPLEPIAKRSTSAQQSLEKEFYVAFLEKLTSQNFT